MRFGIRELVYLVVLLALVAGTWQWGLQPVRAEAAALRADTANKQVVINDLNEARSRYPDFKAEIGRLEEAMAKFDEQLPSQRETEVIVREISEIAAANSLAIDFIKPDRPTQRPEFSELPIQLEVNGDFGAYYRFMRQVEDLPRINRMPRIELSRVRDEARPGAVSVKLTLSIFFEGTAKASG